jgi:hypothetical protein
MAMATATATATATRRPAAARAWVVVLEQELRDLWIGGRGLALSLGFSILLSVVA